MVEFDPSESADAVETTEKSSDLVNKYREDDVCMCEIRTC